ncbi:transcriptional repressor NrdR [Candidatus Pacearchaeota archaeon]|nr:transcriptional repressor NrdR [Candidatus Pacearchaeota archaeon]
MRCPYCLHAETKVVDKRDSNEEGITKRRRECLKCGKRFNTLERLEIVGLRVIKKDGRREAFDKEKLKRGILKACEKRPISTETIEKMLLNVQEKLRKMGKKEVKSEVIGELVSKELKKVDKVAYIRFSSVYRDFRDVSDFKKEIKQLGGK